MADVIRGTWVVSYRELLRFFAEKTRMFSSILLPLAFLAIFGVGFKNLIPNLASGVDFVKFIYPGIVAQTVLQSSMTSGISMVWDREFGFLREILVAPLGRSGIVFGKVIGAAVISLLQSILLLVLAPFLHISLTPLLVAAFIPAALLISISLSSLGVLIASRMRSQQGFQLVTMAIFLPMMFLSGVFFPVNNVPTWMAVISKINPVTYAVDAVRHIILGTEASGAASAIGVTVLGHTMTANQDLLIVVGIGIILLLFATWAFSKRD